MSATIEPRSPNAIRHATPPAPPTAVRSDWSRAGMRESHVHSIVVTRESPNYNAPG